jgi:hypothetical protein
MFQINSYDSSSGANAAAAAAGHQNITQNFQHAGSFVLPPNSFSQLSPQPVRSTIKKKMDVIGSIT